VNDRGLHAAKNGGCAGRGAEKRGKRAGGKNGGLIVISGLLHGEGGRKGAEWGGRWKKWGKKVWATIKGNHHGKARPFHWRVNQ